MGIDCFKELVRARPQDGGWETAKEDDAAAFSLSSESTGKKAYYETSTEWSCFKNKKFVKHLATSKHALKQIVYVI